MYWSNVMEILCCSLTGSQHRETAEEGGMPAGFKGIENVDLSAYPMRLGDHSFAFFAGWSNQARENWRRRKLIC